MFGGIAIAGNLLCVGSTLAQGTLYLFDLEDERLASRWSWEGDDGGPSDAGGVAFDADYNIYVADTRCDVVRSFSAFGLPARTFGAPHVRGPGAVARDRRGRLDRPRDVAIHDGVLYVACGERWLVRGVQRFRLDGTPLSPLRAGGDSQERFGAPRGVWAGPAGIFVADTQHGVVQRFRLEGTYVARIATTLQPEEISRPVAVLPLPDSSLLIVDQGDQPGLHRVALDGRLVDPPAVTVQEIEHPVALAADERGRVYVLDHDGERVVRLDADLGLERELVDLREFGA